MRKRGKNHSKIAALPPGFRRDGKFELPVRAALLSLNELNKVTEQQLYDLFVLAEMARLTGAKGHYLTHADTLKRLVCDLGDRNPHEASDLEVISITASSEILLEYIAKTSNYSIAKAALEGVRA